jgi:uncharacterized RDD family membrane protein YckC
VGFQNKNATLPEWRIQLQNAVQQRKGGSAAASGAAPAMAPAPTPTAEVVRRSEPDIDLGLDMSDPIVAKAMSRIEESRKAFLEPAAPPPQQKKKAQPRPFEVVSRTARESTVTPAPMAVVSPKPEAAPTPTFVQEKRDTNKLPPLENVVVEPVSTPDAPAIAAAAAPVGKKTESGELAAPPEIKRIQIKVERPVENTLFESIGYEDEIEDLAPFSMRFGAGLFDLIIAGFATMLLLSPLAFTNNNWFTTAGLLTLVSSFAIVAFLYMTACLGFYGKTMGMRLFSLELVDAIENEYPTLKQAAVNSCIYLVSLAFCGAGFLTVFFNEERRAAHDLLSGTILVREF